MNSCDERLNGFVEYCAGRGVLRDNQCGDRFAKKIPEYFNLERASER